RARLPQRPGFGDGRPRRRLGRRPPRLLGECAHRRARQDLVDRWKAAQALVHGIAPLAMDPQGGAFGAFSIGFTDARLNALSLSAKSLQSYGNAKVDLAAARLRLCVAKAGSRRDA